MNIGMTNAELSDAWSKKLPGVVPTEQDLTCFALGVEVGLAEEQEQDQYYAGYDAGMKDMMRRVKAELAEQPLPEPVELTDADLLTLAVDEFDKLEPYNAVRFARAVLAAQAGKEKL